MHKTPPFAPKDRYSLSQLAKGKHLLELHKPKVPMCVSLCHGLSWAGVNQKAIHVLGFRVSTRTLAQAGTASRSEIATGTTLTVACGAKRTRQCSNKARSRGPISLAPDATSGPLHWAHYLSAAYHGNVSTGLAMTDNWATGYSPLFQKSHHEEHQHRLLHAGQKSTGIRLMHFTSSGCSVHIITVLRISSDQRVGATCSASKPCQPNINSIGQCIAPRAACRANM